MKFFVSGFLYGPVSAEIERQIFLISFLEMNISWKIQIFWEIYDHLFNLRLSTENHTQSLTPTLSDEIKESHLVRVIFLEDIFIANKLQIIINVKLRFFISFLIINMSQLSKLRHREKSLENFRNLFLKDGMLEFRFEPRIVSILK